MSKYKVGDKVSPKSVTAVEEAEGSKYGTVTWAKDQGVGVVWDNSPWSRALPYWEGSVVPYVEEEEVKKEEEMTIFMAGDRVEPSGRNTASCEALGNLGTVEHIVKGGQIKVRWDNQFDTYIYPPDQLKHWPKKPEVVDTEQSLERGVFVVLDRGEWDVSAFYGTAHEALVQANRDNSLFAAFLQYGKDPSEHEEIR